MLRIAAVLAAAWLAAAVGSAVIVVVTDARRRQRPALRVGAVRRVIRRGRAATIRAASAVAGWPHVIDVAFGTPSTPVAPTPSTRVAQLGTASVTRYTAAEARPGREPVLIVHSLVTRPWVLDLTPERTMVGYLLDAGLDVWLLDWGVASDADAERGLDACVPMVAEAQAIVEEQTGRRCHLVGYCLGATVAIMHAATTSAPPASLVLIAPVAAVGISEHTGRIVGIGRFVVLPWAAAGLVIDHRGLVPGAVIREAFHVLRPRALRTVWSRVRMADVPELRRAYGAMARWAWEQPPLPGRAFLDLVDLHRTNALVRGAWTTSSGPVALERLSMPILVTYSERDHIVASPGRLLAEQGAEHVAFPGGHVGMLVGRQAPLLYETITAFIRERTGGDHAS